MIASFASQPIAANVRPLGLISRTPPIAWIDQTNVTRRAKIVCTLGPACASGDKIAALIEAGMNVARLNFSHGTPAEHAAAIRHIRRAAARLGQPVAILQDLQGPKIRTGTLARGEPVELKDGDEFTITARQVEGSSRQVSTTYAGLPADARPGGCLLLDDGLLELRIERVAGPDVHTRVVHGGMLKEHKGINLPGVTLGLPILTAKDRADLAFGVAQGVDYIAISFVRCAQDVAEVKHALAEINSDAAKLPVIAKLEKPAALEELEAIIDAADGVMVARGDLGVELSLPQVPAAQKRIIRAANQRGKIVITATQMLESMITNPRPTRAEVSDVANAVFDGSDAVMLSAETASGAYPVEAVQAMASVVVEAEAQMKEWGRPVGPSVDHPDADMAIAWAVRDLARTPDVSAVAVFTTDGRPALSVAKTRPDVPVLALTPSHKTYRRLALAGGVVPCLVPDVGSVPEMLALVDATLLRTAFAQPGQKAVVIATPPDGAPSPTSFILLHMVGRLTVHMHGLAIPLTLRWSTPEAPAQEIEAAASQ